MQPVHLLAFIGSAFRIFDSSSPLLLQGRLTAKRPMDVTMLLFSALVRPWTALRAKLGSAVRPPLPFNCLGAIVSERY